MMLENAMGQEGLLVRAYPLEWAEEVSQRMVNVVRTRDGVLLLDADPAWAGAINMVLVSKGLRVSELARSSRYFAPRLRRTELMGHKQVRRRWSSKIPLPHNNDLHGSS